MNAKEKNSLKEFKERLILSTLWKLGGKATINEIISYIWKNNCGLIQIKCPKEDWRFYVHLNKIPCVLEKKKLIKFTGKFKIGETGKLEKIWRLVK